MLKKWGKVIIIGIIIILFSILIFTTVSKELEKINIESPFDMKVEPKLSDSTITCISGKINITNPKNNSAIDIILPKCKGLLKFDDEKFGEITFGLSQEEDNSDKVKTSELKVEEKKIYTIFLWIENSKIPKIWNIYLYNGETGEITMDISIEITVMDIIFNMEFPSSFYKEIDIKISDILNDIILQKTIDKTYTINKLLPRFNFSLQKESGSGEITLSSLRFKLPLRKNLWLSKIQFEDDLSFKCSSEILSVFKQKFTVNARNLIYKILEIGEVLPGEFEIYANDIKIVDIVLEIDHTIEKACLNNYLHSKKSCTMYVEFHDLMLDDFFRLNIKNNCTTFIKTYKCERGKINKNSPINSTRKKLDISNFFNRMVQKDQDKNEIYSVHNFSDIDKWIIFIIIILIIIIIIDYIFEKKLSNR